MVFHETLSCHPVIFFLFYPIRSIEDSNKPGLGRLQGKAMFKDIRGEAEEQIYIALRLKIDEFLELASYDWMLAEPKGTSSSYVLDLIAFLTSTFTAFTNLPVSLEFLFKLW